MKLRTFHTLLFLFILATVMATIYYNYINAKKSMHRYISDWSASTLIQTEASLSDALSAQNLPRIQKILDKGIVTRPFLLSLSLSLDGERYHYSSDRALQGEPIGTDAAMLKAPMEEMISANILHFNIPVEYYRGGTLHHANLLMELDQHYIYDNIIERAKEVSLQALLGITLFFGPMIFFLYRFILKPLNDIIAFIHTRQNGLKTYFIHDFSNLYEVIHESFMTLMEQKQRIQEALEYEKYLEAILQTVAEINKLLIVSKSTEELLQSSCDRLAAHGDYELAWIGFIEEERIDIVSHSEDLTGYLEGGLGITLDPVDPTSKGPAAQSILRNKPVIIQNLQSDPSFAPWKKRSEHSHFHAIVALPLRKDLYSDAFGTLAIYTSNRDGFDPKEVAMLEELSGDIGFAIHSFEQDLLLKKHLSTDSLTGLPNRSSLITRIAEEKMPEVMILTIDRFKDINEVYGFEVGDEFLKLFAAELERLIADKKAITLYNIGIDNFALHFDEGHTLGVRSFAEWLITALESQIYTSKEVKLMPLVSAGYARSPEHTIERAEMALKHAREEKKKVFLFDPSMRMVEHYEENMKWYRIVHEAIIEGRILPYYQGIVNTQSKETVKHEALLRLILPDGTIVSPFRFLEIAKKTRLYTHLTTKVLSDALATFSTMETEVSINLSLIDILNQDIVNLLRSTLHEYNIGHRVIFEILESDGIEDYERVNHFINEFKTLGCRIAIDDFGSGYSNFDHLLTLNIDYLKIDGSLIQNIAHDHNAEIMVKHIHSFATDMGIQTIAEFVSTEEVYKKVKEIGITYSQGYYFHQPAPKPEYR